MNLFDDENNEINITPLIDVFLVLLTIFISISVLYFKNETHLEKINIPEVSKSSSSKQHFKKAKYIYVTNDGSIKYNGEKYNIKKFNNLVTQKKIGIKNNDQIILSADQDIKYKFIIDLMSNLKYSGLNNINLEIKEKI